MAQNPVLRDQVGSRVRGACVARACRVNERPPKYVQSWLYSMVAIECEVREPAEVLQIDENLGKSKFGKGGETMGQENGV